MSILIENVTIVTMESEEAVIENGFIAIEGDRISCVGSVRPAGDFDETVDGRGKVAMPGLVNAHAHTSMTLMRSYADDMNLHDWLTQKIFPYEDKMTRKDVYNGSLIGIREMLESGTTCFNDMYFFQEATGHAAVNSGIRGALCECVTDGGFEKKCEKTRELKEEFGGNKNIKIGFSHHSVYTCSPETIKKCVEFVKSGGAAYLHTHLSETIKENEDCMAEYAKTPTELMLECGVFDVPCIAAHCVHVSESDMQILKEYNVTAAHCPTSNLKLASGVAPIPEMLSMGINVALGTDGASSNNNLDMFEEIKIAAILHKGVSGDPTVVSAYEALKMATVNGAHAMGYVDLGMIKSGFLADIILLDFDSPHLTPNHNTISNLAYSANGGDVCMSIVGGKIVYRCI